jgi:hypothetical protein
MRPVHNCWRSLSKDRTARSISRSCTLVHLARESVQHTPERPAPHKHAQNARKHRSYTRWHHWDVERGLVSDLSLPSLKSARGTCQDARWKGKSGLMVVGEHSVGSAAASDRCSISAPSWTTSCPPSIAARSCKTWHSLECCNRALPRKAGTGIALAVWMCVLWPWLVCWASGGGHVGGAFREGSMISASAHGVSGILAVATALPIA